jgi:hypothetical protein
VDIEEQKIEARTAELVLYEMVCSSDENAELKHYRKKEYLPITLT